MKLSKELENSRTMAMSIAEEINNPNRCKDRDKQIYVIQQMILGAKIEAIESVIKVYGQYTRTSPGFDSIVGMRDDLRDLRKAIQ